MLEFTTLFCVVLVYGYLCILKYVLDSLTLCALMPLAYIEQSMRSESEGDPAQRKVRIRV